MSEKEIDLLLKGFKNHVNKLLYCEEELVDIKLQLKGIRRVRAKKHNEETFTGGTRVYRNKQTEIIDRQSETRKQRNYHLYAVRQVMHMLRMLDEEEVELLEMYYWDDLTRESIGNLLKLDTSVITKRINRILLKLHNCAR